MSTHFACAYCGAGIPAAIIEKRHYSPATMPPRVYCDKKHMNAHRQQIGEFKQMSVYAWQPCSSRLHGASVDVLSTLAPNIFPSRKLPQKPLDFLCSFCYNTNRD